MSDAVRSILPCCAGALSPDNSVRFARAGQDYAPIYGLTGPVPTRGFIPGTLFLSALGHSSHRLQAVLETLVARSREHYMHWRKGLQANDDQTDEICILVRRIVPTNCNGHVLGNPTVADPFERAHPYLRRRLEQATAADPCMESGLHLTRIRGPVGTILHAQSDVRSYGAPGEPLRAGTGGAPRAGDWAAPARDAQSAPSHATSFAALVMNSDIADSSWMSWI